MKRKHPDVLGADRRPLFFEVAKAREIGLEPPADRHGMALRTWVRALAGMQKEAVVVHGATGRAWRLTSDEGPYLDGHDAGPCPLSFLTTGMVSSYMTELLALAAMRGIALGEVELVLDNHYSMEGSALRGTMTGGALAPELTARLESDADPATLRKLLVEAAGASPVNGWMRRRHTSLFTLTCNGRRIDVGRVAALAGEPAPDPADRFEEIRPRRARPGRARPGRAGPGSGDAEVLVRKLVPAREVEGVKHGVHSSLEDHQSRRLHVQGICTVRSDGVKVVEQRLYKPIGSTFRFLCDEAPEHGGKGLAPDAASYLSAGIGFCFMTQVGRYAEIAKKKLDSYRIVQDTHFSRGGASGGSGQAGTAEAVETHLYVETPEGDDFARTVLDMSEQTCFLHAFCRTELKPRLRLQPARPA